MNTSDTTSVQAENTVQSQEIDTAIRLNTERGIDRLTKQKNTLRDEVHALNSEKIQIQKDLASLRTQKGAEEQHLVDILDKNSDRVAQSENAIAEAQLNATKKIKEYEDAIKLKHEELLIASTTLDAKKADIKVITVAISEKEAEKSALELTIAGHTSTISTLESKIGVHSAHITTQESQIAKNTHHISELKTEITTQESSLKVLKDEVELLVKDKMRYADRKMKLDQREEWLRARYEAAGIVWKELES